MISPQTAQQAEWQDPAHNPPPTAKKILLLTYTGSACIGCWDVGFIAWAPLPKIPNTIKNKISHQTP